MASAESALASTVTVRVVLMSGQDLGLFELPGSSTVGELLRQVFAAGATGVKKVNLRSARLLLDEGILEEDAVLCQKVPQGATLQLLMMPRQFVVSALRCRPPTAKEQSTGSTPVLRLDPKQGLAAVRRDERSTKVSLDLVYDESTPTEDIFHDAVSDLVLGTLAGRSGAVLLRGAASSGKSHTLFAADGLLQQTFNTLEEQLGGRLEHVAISVEFFEVINELVFDLLATEEKIESGHRTRFQTGGETHVEGVPRRGCRTADEMRAFLAHGLRQREQLATGRLAGGQSRSTLLFTLCVDVLEGVDRELKHAVLQFIRLPSTSRPPSRPLRESESSSAVVMSLSSVSTVFSYLIPQNRGRKRTIPWRDSCCTRLLYNALRNGAHVVFIGTVSSSEDAVEDTFDTLRFLQRAREAVTTEPLQAPTTREAPLSFATPPETTEPP